MLNPLSQMHMMQINVPTRDPACGFVILGSKTWVGVLDSVPERTTRAEEGAPFREPKGQPA